MYKANLLSSSAKNMIDSCDKIETIKGKGLIDILRRLDIPNFEAILCFQENYGGLSIRFGRVAKNGYILDLFHNGKGNRVNPCISEYEGKILIKCIHSYISEYTGYFMDEGGKIYSYIDGRYAIYANSIEELLDSMAVKHRILNIQKIWFTKRFTDSEFSNWLTNKKFALCEIKEASSEYDKWWKSVDNTIFFNLMYKNSHSYWGTAFAANSECLKKLEGDGFSSYSIFPYNVIYNFEKKIALVDNPKEVYYFNEKLYHTCDANYIHVLPVNEPDDVYLYLSGKKDFKVRKPVQEFLDTFSKFNLNNEAFDSNLLKYAIENNSYNILRLIDYIFEMDNNNIRYRTVGESYIDILLAGEYFRRLAEFADSEHIEPVHPLFGYGLNVAGSSEEVNVDLLYSKVNKIKQSYDKTHMESCLKYMKLAQEGNKIAAKYYKIFEPLLLIFALGGSFEKSHGYFLIGGCSFTAHSWRSRIGKTPIDIYKELPKAWATRHFNHAIGRINSIKWSADEQLPRLSETLNNKILSVLKSLFSSFKTTERVGYPSFLYLARKLGEDPMSNLIELCPNLIKVENTLIRGICESYLEWAVLIDEGNSAALNNPCLYEPFIDLIIQGGNLSELNKKILRLIEVMASKPIISYSDFLNSKD